MQNLGGYYTTFNIGREYLRNESRYPKNATENDSSCVRQNPVNFSPLPERRTCEFGLTQIDILADYILVPQECWHLKFLHALEFDQDLLAHTTNGVGVSKKF